MESFMKYISRTARYATSYRHTKLSKNGLNGCQHTYIFQICKTPGISQEQLAKNIFVNKSSVTRQLSLLEQNGFVSRRPSETDKRIMHVYPTEKALHIFPQVCAVTKHWNEQILEEFSSAEQQTLLSMMERVMQKAAILAQEVYEEKDVHS